MVIHMKIVFSGSFNIFNIFRLWIRETVDTDSLDMGVLLYIE